MKILRRTLVASSFWLAAALFCNADTIIWTNAASGSWNTAANWSPNEAPGAADTAIITNANITVTLTAASSAGQIFLGASNNCGASTILEMNGQTLGIGGLFSIGSCGQFTLDGGVLTGVTETTSVSGAMGWTGGNLAGTLTLNPNATLTISGGGNHDMSDTTLTNNGTVSWVTGTIRGGGTPGTFIANNGLWDCQSDQQFQDAFNGNGTTFDNWGTFRKSGGAGANNSTQIEQGIVFNQLAGEIDVQSGVAGLNLVLQGGGTFSGGFITTNLNALTVLSAGNFNIDGTITGTNTVENAGDLTGNNVINGALTWAGGDWDSANVTITPGSGVLVTGTGNMDMSNCSLTNNGTFAWVSGTIRGGGNPGTFVYNNGVWDAQSDQQFQDAFNGDGTVFNNTGTFEKTGGTLSPGTVVAQGVLYNQTTGVLDAAVGAVVLQGNGNFTGGSITAVGTGVTVLSSGNFNLNGVLLASNIVEDAGDLVGNNLINGNLTWAGGDWDGANVTISPGATVFVTGTGNMDMSNCLLTNNGTFAWTSGTVRGGGNPGTIIYNNGLWDAQSDQQLQGAFNGAGVVFNNFATFQKSGGTLSPGTLLTDGVLYNQTSGVLDAKTGSIVLQNGGNFTGGSVTAVGTGVTVLSEGDFNLNGVLLVSNIVENAGILVGNNLINGNLTWVGGNWNGANVTITPGATVFVTGTGDMDMSNCLLTNNGTFAWTSGTVRGGGNPGTIIYNNGLWDAQSDQQLQGAFNGAGVVFNNFATFQKSGGTLSPGTLLTDGVLYNQTSGVLDAKTGSIVLQNGGNFTGGSVTAVGTGVTVLSEGDFNLNGVLLASNIVENAGILVGNNLINGNLTWAGGNWNGANVTITPGATVFVTGTGNMDMSNCLLTNNGTFAWTSGTVRGGGNPGTIIYNNGLWDAQSDQQLQGAFNGAGLVFNDAGTFQKSGGAGGNNNTLFTGGAVFNKLAGKIDVQNGTNGLVLVLQGGGTFSGGFITSQTNGETVLSEGNFTLKGTVTSTNTFENAGVLFGNNVIMGALQWAGGNWDNANVTIAPNSTVFVIGGGNNMDMSNASVTNNGTFAWTSGILRGGGNPGTMIYNNGLWDAQSDQQFQGAFNGAGIIFNNNPAGTFNKSTTAGTTAFTETTFTNSGAIKALTGTVAFTSGSTLDQNHGTIRFGLASTTTFGQVSVSNPLALNGTLALQLLGGFMPALGNSFTPLTSTADSSKFENLNLTTLPAGDAWQVAYNPASVTLTVVAAGSQQGLITGAVKDAPTHGVPGISVFAFSDQNPTFYYSTTTDANGNYSLNSTNGNITVGLANLQASGYNSVADQVVVLSGTQETQVVNFVIQAIGASAPSAVTTTANSVTSSSATLAGTVNPNGEAVSVYYQYGIGALNQTTPTNTITTSLNTIQPVQIPINGLMPATQYEFQLVAQNSYGTSDGGIMNFITPGIAPVVQTEPATDIGSTNATVNGTINPGGLQAAWYFEYGTTTNYGSFTPTNLLVAGNLTIMVTNEISNLQPATIYHYQLIGSNALGVIPGGDLTFTNLPAAPTVVTLAATGLDANGATLNGSVNPNGLATSWYFEWGTDMTYGNFTLTNNLAPTNIVEAVASALGGLNPNSPYHFQLVAANSLGTNFGGDQFFSTADVGASVVCPGMIVTNSAPGTCGQTVIFAATASGNPSPVVTYTLGGTPITSPFNFPVGTNVVSVTASNQANVDMCQFTVVVIDSTPPIAGLNQLGTFENKAASVDVAKVLLRDKSQSGSPLSIVGVVTPTANGATVTLGAGKITYSPAAGFIGADTLTYTLSDGCGSVPGTIAVAVLATNLPAANQVSLTATLNSRTVVFAGVPGASYVVQSAPAMNGPWTDLSPVTQAAANGLMQYTDTTFPVPAMRFYRTRYVSGP